MNPPIMKNIMLLEMFAGSCTMSKTADLRKIARMATDIEPFPGINLVADVLKLDPNNIPKHINVIWASPPCTSFSVASIGHHWKGGFRAYQPKTEAAEMGLEILRHTLAIIQEVKPKIWFIENPRGLMRKMPEMEGLKRHTITYCQYGDTRMKPTDIWTNCTTWKPRPMCKNGSPCHEAAPRGSRTGTQGLKNNFERSKLPQQLCDEIMDAIETQLKG